MTLEELDWSVRNGAELLHNTFLPIEQKHLLLLHMVSQAPKQYYLLLDKALFIKGRSPLAIKFRPIERDGQLVEAESFAQYTKSLLFDSSQKPIQAVDALPMRFTLDELDKAF